jgi:hypothetical protein
MGEAVIGLFGVTVILFLVTGVIAYILYGGNRT